MEGLVLIGDWLEPDRLGSWASILALVVGLFSVLKIRSIRHNIKNDREFLQEIVSLPEIHFYLQQVRKYLEEILESDPRDTARRLGLLHGITSSEIHLKIFFGFSYGIDVDGSNAFVRAAKYYESIGQIDRAAIYYKKALKASGHQEGPDQSNLLNREDLYQCCNGLQFCYLSTWQLKEAVGIGKWGQEHGLDCIPGDKVERRFLVLCPMATLRLVFRTLNSTLRRARSRIRTLRIL